MMYPFRQLSVVHMFRSIVFIKSLHTVIFFFMSICNGIIAYSAITGRVGGATRIAFAVIVVEGLALYLNGGRCPLTTYAERVGARRGAITDIFLPKWFADRIFTLCGGMFAISCILLAIRWLL
jgi:hypothetical protein